MHVECRIKIHVPRKRSSLQDQRLVCLCCVRRGASVTSIPSGLHMISHILGFLSFFVVGVVGVIGEPGISSGASATAGSLGATEDFDRTNSPIASSIDVRVSSGGDLGDESQAPGNNRDDVEDAYRALGETFETPEGSTDVSRSNFGLSFSCEYRCGAIDMKGE